MKQTTGLTEIECYLAHHPAPEFVDAFFADLSGVFRGKRYPAEHLPNIMTKGMALPGSVFLLAVTGESMDPDGYGFSDGDPDELAKVIPGSLQPVPWMETPTAQVMLSLENTRGEPYYFEPRNVLRRVLDTFIELDLRPVVAFELEFYLLDSQRTATGAPQPPPSPITDRPLHATQVYGMQELDDFAAFISAVTRACAQQGIATGALTSEYAPGQFEINLQHSDDPLRAADHAVMFKRAVQGIARQFGYQASFMAKPYQEQAGSGMHLHLSLIDEQGRNVFDGGGESGTPECASTLLRYGIGGLLQIMPDSMALLAPNVNAYRRYQPNIFVPIQRSWGFENRSTALRIPTGDGSARRIEHRLAGADANPYLALASVLAGVHYGITQHCDPGSAFVGNACERFDPDLPFRLRPALAKLADSEILKQYFGADYVSAYVDCKRRELDAFEQHISPTEYAWYLGV